MAVQKAEKQLAANGQKQLAAAYGEKNARKAAVPSHRVSAPDLASSDGSSSQRTTNSAIDELDCVLFLDVDWASCIRPIQSMSASSSARRAWIC